MHYQTKIKNIDNSCEIIRAPLDAQGFASCLIAQNFSQNDLVFVAQNDASMDEIKAQIEFFAPHLLSEYQLIFFNAWDCAPYDQNSPKQIIAAQRIRALHKLSARNDGQKFLVITSINALLQKILPKKLIKKSYFKARAGDKISIDDVANFLVFNGYQRQSLAYSASEFSIRGGIVDIVMERASDLVGYRLDFFGQELESIKEFDPMTQLSSDKLREIELLPAGEITLNQETIEIFRQKYRAYFGANFNLNNYDPIYESVSQSRFYQGLEHFLPLFYHEELTDLFSYLNKPTIFLDDKIKTLAKAHEERVLESYNSRITALNQKNFAEIVINPLKPDALYFSANEFGEALKNSTAITFHEFDFADKNARIIDLEIESVPNFYLAAKSGAKLAGVGEEEDATPRDPVLLFADYARAAAKNGKKILVAALSENSRDRVAKLFADYEVDGAFDGVALDNRRGSLREPLVDDGKRGQAPVKMVAGRGQTPAGSDPTLSQPQPPRGLTPQGSDPLSGKTLTTNRRGSLREPLAEANTLRQAQHDTSGINEIRDKNENVMLGLSRHGGRGEISGRGENAGLTQSAPTKAQSGGGKIPVIICPLEKGFAMTDLVVVGEQAIFGEKILRKKSARSKDASKRILEEGLSINVGELVVHRDYGIGKFDGIHKIEAGEVKTDMLKIIYGGGDVLFVSVDDINLITRYGDDNPLIQLDKLGVAAWKNRKGKVRNRIKVAAKQLIELAAKRQVMKAPILTAPEHLYDEFKAQFGYVETQDQLNAINDVEEDLAKGAPMDRLICGDVGFGKTEVAMRAAFIVAASGREVGAHNMARNSVRADTQVSPYDITRNPVVSPHRVDAVDPYEMSKHVADSYETINQVAIITPTTLLCRQHYKNFIKRFENSGLKIAQISRLTSATQNKKTRQELENGEIDIVIGTHALLQKNVKFKNLALVIIDEEQHFGVAQKERLKEFKSQIHILTLSATPIPRTLQMSLTGVKDLSLIASPPLDRLAVRNFVMKFDSVTAKEAILREYQRSGKVFFVVPRVKYIAEMEDKLRKILPPEIKVKHAHGQMAAGEIDDIMNDFYDDKIDVLLSTTIIESGIDVASANTMIIYKAEMFGLSQLYQLRGRVGRGKTRGYAYFMTSDKEIKADSKKKLEVMQHLDALGVGFSIASHDMDIRGAGDILGDEQSGHIKETGVELYQQMLLEEIEHQKNKLPREKDAQNEEIYDSDFAPQIKLGVSLIIPQDYILDVGLRMNFYKKIANLGGELVEEACAATAGRGLTLQGSDPVGGVSVVAGGRGQTPAGSDPVNHNNTVNHNSLVSGENPVGKTGIAITKTQPLFTAINGSQARLALLDELVDRFGKMDDDTKDGIENLINIATLKALCKKARIEKIESNKDGVLLSFWKNKCRNPEKLLEMIMKNPAEVKLQANHKILFLNQKKYDKIGFSFRVLDKILALD